jgi:predicted anti-sigma-YlaC factor YlaD
MIAHPSADQLVAYADGDAAGVDLAGLARHVVACAQCRETVAELARTRAMLRRSAEERDLPPAPAKWTALSARIASHRRKRGAARWTARLLAASVVGVVLLSQIRSRPDDGGTAAGPAIEDVPTIAAGDDEAIALLSRAVAEGRGRLPSSEQQAMDAVLRSIDDAVRHTRSELRADPSDPWLRSHLGELHRKRVSALQDYVDLIRDQG